MVTSSFLPGRGGIESYLAELSLELAPRLAVFAQSKRNGIPAPRDLPYRFFGYDDSLLFPRPRVERAIRAAAEAAGTQMILFGTPWPLALLGPRLKKSGLRYASIVHGSEILIPAAVPGVASKLAEALSGADLLLPVSSFTRDRLKNFLGPRNHPPVEVLRARVDSDRFNPDVDSSSIRRRYGMEDRDVVLTFGRLVRRKGVHRLLEVLPEVARRRPKVSLVIAGTGPDEGRIRRRGRGFGDRVIFTGRISDEDAPALHAAADVFALAVVDRWRGADTEGLGVVLLEASATGTPCVTGRSGGTPEAVLDGVTGRVIDAHDKRQLTEAVVWMLENRSQANQMGALARRHVTSQFAERPLPRALLEWLSVPE
jgi:phosphatidyl-myo-inositol dimannoside synthase